MISCKLNNLYIHNELFRKIAGIGRPHGETQANNCGLTINDPPAPPPRTYEHCYPSYFSMFNKMLPIKLGIIIIY